MHLSIDRKSERQLSVAITEGRISAEELPQQSPHSQTTASSALNLSYPSWLPDLVNHHIANSLEPSCLQSLTCKQSSARLAKLSLSICNFSVTGKRQVGDSPARTNRRHYTTDERQSWLPALAIAVQWWQPFRRHPCGKRKTSSVDNNWTEDNKMKATLHHIVKRRICEVKCWKENKMKDYN